MLSPGNPFNSSVLTPSLIKCIQNALSPGGILSICTCGYRIKPPPPGPMGGLVTLMGMQAWDDSLQDLANKLGRKVCACPSGAQTDSRFGCRCTVSTTFGYEIDPVCKDPKK